MQVSSGSKQNAFNAPWALAVIGSTLLLLTPALWNGFPIMFYDTGAFIAQALSNEFVPERSVFYAWFLAASGLHFGLWPPIIAQALTTSLMIVVLVRSANTTATQYFAVVVLLWFTTALPWYAAQVMPDILASLLVLSLYVLAFRDHTLNWPTRLALIALAIVAITSHASHLALAAGLTIYVGLIQITLRNSLPQQSRPRWLWPVYIVLVSLASMVVSNIARTGDVFLSRAGPAFILGRLVQDGIVQRVLNDTCPASGYRLCQFKDNMPKTADDYLWAGSSPFKVLGGFEASEAESRAIIVESLKRYPLLHIKTAFTNTLEQFVSFKSGDGTVPQQAELLPVLERFLPDVLAAYSAAKQQNDKIRFEWLNLVHVIVGALSLLGLMWLLVNGWRRRNWTDQTLLPAFILVALIGNAFICGVLSNPHDRYQSRLMWLATAVSVLVMTQKLSARSADSSAS